MGIKANLCLMTIDDDEVEQVLKERCLKAQPKRKQPWYLDNRCSRHVIGDESLFQKLDKKKSGNVSFGDNSKGVIRGIETIGNNSHTQIKNVLLAENLKYNLLRISQLCDKGFRVCFESNACHVINSTTSQIIYIGKGMRMCMSFILMMLCLMLNHV